MRLIPYYESREEESCTSGVTTTITNNGTNGSGSTTSTGTAPAGSKALAKKAAYAVLLLAAAVAAKLLVDEYDVDIKTKLETKQNTSAVVQTVHVVQTSSTTGKSPPLMSQTSRHNNNVSDKTVNANANPVIGSTSTANANTNTNNKKNEEFNTRHNLLPGTRVCHIDDPVKPAFGDTPLDLRDSMLKDMGYLSFRYQCAGPRYMEYTTKVMIPYIQKKQKDFPQWGTRPTILPPPSPSPPTTTSATTGNNKSILVIGNSHHRQVITTLFCQYRDQFVASQLFVPFSKDPALVSSVLTFTNNNNNPNNNHNVTFYVMTNHPIVYSTHWKAIIETEVIMQPFQNLDAIIFGFINPTDPTGKFINATLWKSTRQYAKDNPNHQIDLSLKPRGIELQELIQNYSDPYDKPIIRVSMFSQGNERGYQEGVQLFQQHQQTMTTTTTATGEEEIENHNNRRGQNNLLLHSINARQHVWDDENGEQCSSNVWQTVSDCAPQGHHIYGDGHRCMGENGGEPDLAAFDLVEKLWEIFSS